MKKILLSLFLGVAICMHSFACITVESSSDVGSFTSFFSKNENDSFAKSYLFNIQNDWLGSKRDVLTVEFPTRSLNSVDWNTQQENKYGSDPYYFAFRTTAYNNDVLYVDSVLGEGIYGGSLIYTPNTSSGINWEGSWQLGGVDEGEDYYCLIGREYNWKFYDSLYGYRNDSPIYVNNTGQFPWEGSWESSHNPNLTVYFMAVELTNMNKEINIALPATVKIKVNDFNDQCSRLTLQYLKHIDEDNVAWTTIGTVDPSEFSLTDRPVAYFGQNCLSEDLIDDYNFQPNSTVILRLYYINGIYESFDITDDYAGYPFSFVLKIKENKRAN